MAKRNSHLISRVPANQYIEKARQLAEQGYSVLMPKEQSFFQDNPGLAWGDFIGAQLRSGTTTTGTGQRKAIPSLYFSSGNENMQGTDSIGTPNLGWMEWGFGNALPNLVALLTHLLPYTAAGIKFNADLSAALGPQPMYDTAQYIGGNISTRFIRYKDAGIFLRGQIIDKQRELLHLLSNQTASSEAHPDGGGEDGASDEGFLGGVFGNNENEAAEKVLNELKASLEEQIKELQEALEVWKKTEPEVQDFIERNNLAQTWLALVLDQELFGICFPELLLNQKEVDANGKPVKTADWKPKVVGIAHRSCHTTRLERMDEHNQINFVYCSNRWLDAPFIDQGTVQPPINAVPALPKEAPLPALQERVRKARMEGVTEEKRPTHFVLPSIYPTAGRPYYPTPAWHSIFGGDIYEYLSTIISDRLSRKRNSNIIGRVIYLHNDYLNQLFVQKKVTGDQKMMAAVRDQLYAQINAWLANRNNAGQSLLAFTFMGTDGKEHRSFEVVEIEAASKSTAEANEKETAEISSVVFMALGLDARLLGSSPLSLVGSNGGTDIRERYLLRLLLKAPTQNILLKPLEVTSAFNNWDKLLVWQIQREVMTTLDRSKSGITSHNADNASNNSQ